MSNEFRTYATFVFDPAGDPRFSESVESESEAPGGRGIAEFLFESLKEGGCDVSHFDQHESYGWSFYASFGSVPVWCMLQFCEPWLLITKVDFLLWYSIRGRRPREHQAEACRRIHAALSQSERVSSLLWFTREQFEKQQAGSQHP